MHVKSIALFCLAAMAWSCGSDFKKPKFNSAQTKDARSKPKAESDELAQDAEQLEEVASLEEASYLLAVGCNSESKFRPRSDRTVLSGKESYLLPANQIVSLAAVGQTCLPETVKRDIVFVVDISGSMGPGWFDPGADPLKNGSCGRKEAITKIIRSLPKHNAVNVALVLFDVEAIDKTSGFVDAETFLSSYAGSDVLCQARGGTSYRAPLQKTDELLELARSDSQKEVYFISDGQPSLQSEVGAKEAARVREQAMIATLMLKGNDRILIEQIASHDADGNPRHAKVEDANDLAEALTELAGIELSLAHLRFKAANDFDWRQTVSIAFDYERTDVLELFEYDQSDFPEGIEVEFVFTDERLQTHASSAVVGWEEL